MVDFLQGGGSEESDASMVEQRGNETSHEIT